jgi:hypothetical protein
LPWWWGSSADVQLREAPPGLTAALDMEVAPGGHVFAHQPWGSWFEYALPDRLYFVDSRIEILPAPIWTDYDQVAFSGARWHEVLEEWKPDAIVAEHEDWDLIPILRDDPAWRVAYEDEDGVLFVAAP